MKRLSVILFFCVSICSKCQFNIPLITRGPVYFESGAQRVTDSYITLVNASSSDATAIRRAVKASEDNGLYDKIYKLTIYKYYTNGRCPNLIVPLLYNGAFCDSLRNGPALVVNSSGVVIANTDTLATFWINDITSAAPNNGFFWYVGSSVEKQILSSTSPFRVFPRDAGTTAFVNIWNNSPGVLVPAPPSGFNYAQRTNSTTVDIFQGTTKYSAASSINSSSPINQWCEIIGNNSASYTLKISGITSVLTDTEVSLLKSILDNLAVDLGL